MIGLMPGAALARPALAPQTTKAFEAESDPAAPLANTLS